MGLFGKSTPEGSRWEAAAAPRDVSPIKAGNDHEGDESDELLGQQISATGPQEPPGVGEVPDDGESVLSAVRGEGTADLWVVGLHGGSGASTVAALLTEVAGDEGPVVREHHGYSHGQFPRSGRVLLVARDSGRGVERATRAAREWGAGETGLDAVGLIIVASGSQLPKGLRTELRQVMQMWPRTWRIGWVPTWHLESVPDVGTAGGRIRRTARDVLQRANVRGEETP